VKQNFTIRKRVYLMPIILLLGLLLFMVTKQFMADFYWKMAQQHEKEPNQIIGYLEKSNAIEGKNSLFHFSLGRAYLHKGLTDVTKISEKNQWIRRSINEFQKAINLEPVNSDYHFHLGISYGSLAYPPHFYWKVIQNSFKRTAILNPTEIRHLDSIGIYYLNEYNRLINISRDTSDLRLEKYVAMSRKNYQFYFRKLLEVNEEYLGKILARCFAGTQQHSDLRGVIRDTPSDHAFLAHFLNKKGMWEEAKKEYKEAINLEPINPNHYSKLAYALFRRGDYRNAIYWWQKQKALDPQDDNPYLCSVNGFMKLKRFDEALRELRDLMVLYPQNINYQVKLIRILLAARRVDEAIHEYHKIMGNDPHFSKTMYDTILRYQRKGDYRKATRILNDALLSALNR